MGFRYKPDVDILKMLKDAGYSSYRLFKEQQMLETTDKLNETQDETLHETDETLHAFHVTNNETDETGNNSNSKNYSNNRSYIHNQNNNKCVYVDEYGREYELEPTDDIPMPDDSDCPPEHYDGSYCCSN